MTHFPCEFGAYPLQHYPHVLAEKLNDLQQGSIGKQYPEMMQKPWQHTAHKFGKEKYLQYELSLLRISYSDLEVLFGLVLVYGTLAIFQLWSVALKVAVSADDFYPVSLLTSPQPVLDSLSARSLVFYWMGRSIQPSDLLQQKPSTLVYPCLHIKQLLSSCRSQLDSKLAFEMQLYPLELQPFLHCRQTPFDGLAATQLIGCATHTPSTNENPLEHSVHFPLKDLQLRTPTQAPMFSARPDMHLRHLLAEGLRMQPEQSLTQVPAMRRQVGRQVAQVCQSAYVLQKPTLGIVQPPARVGLQPSWQAEQTEAVLSHSRQPEQQFWAYERERMRARTSQRGSMSEQLQGIMHIIGTRKKSEYSLSAQLARRVQQLDGMRDHQSGCTSVSD